MENENKNVVENLQNAQKIIRSIDGCEGSIRNAVYDLHDCIDYLLENVKAHDLLHGQNINFMTANYLHTIAASLSQLIDEDEK